MRRSFTDPRAEDVATAIRDAVECETRRSRYRDRWSREPVHPAQHDVGAIIDFVIDRRKRQQGALEAARRVCKSVDTAALRFLIAVVLDGGVSTVAIRRSCTRVLAHCDAIEAALAQRQHQLSIRERCWAAVTEALAVYGDEQATAEVLTEVSELLYEGDDEVYAQAVAAVARKVWQKKLDLVTDRIKQLEAETAALRAINRMPPCNGVH